LGIKPHEAAGAAFDHLEHAIGRGVQAIGADDQNAIFGVAAGGARIALGRG
jgi:hypothetical protein